MLLSRECWVSESFVPKEPNLMHPSSPSHKPRPGKNKLSPLRYRTLGGAAPGLHLRAAPSLRTYNMRKVRYTRCIRIAYPSMCICRTRSLHDTPSATELSLVCEKRSPPPAPPPPSPSLSSLSSQAAGGSIVPGDAPAATATVAASSSSEEASQSSGTPESRCSSRSTTGAAGGRSSSNSRSRSSARGDLAQAR